MSSQTLPASVPLNGARDGVLVREHLRGREGAFSELFERYHDSLVGYCVKRVKCEALAEDLAQDVLIRALVEHADEYETDRPAWPWLKAIANNLIVDHARKHQREELTPAPINEEDEVEDDMAAMVAERPLLEEAMAQLPDRQRVAVRLRYLEQWKSSEGAEFLDLSRPAFEQLLFRARTNLRKKYERLADQPPRRWAGTLLLPLYRVRDALVSRLRARVTGWEQTLHAMGPAAFDAIGQAATTVAVLGLVSGIVGGASSDASEEVTGVPAGAVMPQAGYHAGSGASAEAPAGGASEVGGPDVTEGGAATATRHVQVDAPTTSETQDVAGASGHLESKDSEDRVAVDAVIRARLGPYDPGMAPHVWVDCDGNPVREAECSAVRTVDEGAP